jgi:hypothetical protein
MEQAGRRYREGKAGDHFRAATRLKFAISERAAARRDSSPARPKTYQKNLAVIWTTRGLLLNVFVGLLNSGLLTVT